MKGLTICIEVHLDSSDKNNKRNGREIFGEIFGIERKIDFCEFLLYLIAYVTGKNAYYFYIDKKTEFE